MFCKRILDLSHNRANVLRETFEVYVKSSLSSSFLNYELVSILKSVLILYLLEGSFVVPIWWFEKYPFIKLFSVQFSSVAQSCLTLCDPNHSTPSLPVHHQLPEFTQTHVHRGGDAIQPSHPLSPPSPPAPNPS